CSTDSSIASAGWRVDTIAFTNSVPALQPQTNRTIAELTSLTVTNTATDPEAPPQTLTYQLVTTATNANIDGNGVITWTPNETQGASTNIFTTVVTDNGIPAASASNTFTVIVTE